MLATDGTTTEVGDLGGWTLLRLKDALESDESLVLNSDNPEHRL